MSNAKNGENKQTKRTRIKPLLTGINNFSNNRDNINKRAGAKPAPPSKLFNNRENKFNNKQDQRSIAGP